MFNSINWMSGRLSGWAKVGVSPTALDTFLNDTSDCTTACPEAPAEEAIDHGEGVLPCEEGVHGLSVGLAEEVIDEAVEHGHSEAVPPVIELDH